MNNQDIKQRILTSIEKAREEGYTLIQGDWGDERMKCACAIGCVYVAANQHIDSNYEDAADLWEWMKAGFLLSLMVSI